jgi:hypothetical protein
MHPAVAHAQAIHDGIAQWPAALDNSRLCSDGRVTRQSGPLRGGLSPKP